MSKQRNFFNKNFCVKIIFIFSYANFQTSCFCQEENFYFHHLNLDSKLSQTNNREVYRDSRGLVWIGSQSGLNCFDGQDIQVYRDGGGKSGELWGDNIVSGFVEDSDGNIWFSTPEAVNCFERKTGKFKHFVFENKNKEVLSNYVVVGIRQNRDIWVATQANGLYILNRFTGAYDSFHNLFQGVHRGKVDTNEQGDIRYFFAYSSNAFGLQISAYQNNQLINQQIKFDETNGDIKLRVLHILKEHDNAFWLSTDQGLFLFNPKTFQIQRIAAFPPEQPDVLNACAHYKNGYLLCASAKSGLLLFTKGGKLVQRIKNDLNNAHSLAGDNITNVVVDNQGYIWASIDAIGIDFTHIWQSKPFKQLLSNDSSPHLNFPVQAGAMIEAQDGSNWCSAWKGGLFVFDRNKKLRAHYSSEKSRPFSLISNYIFYTFKDSKSRVWVETLKGLELFNPNLNKFDQITGMDKRFIHGLELNDGTILFCNLLGGIYRLVEYSDNKFRFDLHSAFDSTNAYTTLFESTDGRLFAASETKAIVVYSKSQNYKLDSVLPIRGIITSFWENKLKNEVWAATSNGLAIIDLKTLRYRLLTEKNGLPDRCIHSILPADSGQIWISTNRGLSQTDTEARIFHNFTYADGLSSYEFRDFSAMLRSNGEIWFGSTNGITYFDPRQIKSLPVAATPQIVKILINDTEANDSSYVSSDAQNPTEMKHIVLRHDNNTLSFHLASLEYCDPENTRLRYYMRGIDSDTLESEGHWLARYPKLQPGTYQLLIWAANSDGEWNPIARILEIEILPPFWQQSWFIAICIIAVLSMAWYLHKLSLHRQLKINQLKAERQIAVEKERKRIARDMHDDIGSGLSELGLIAELTKQKTLDSGIKKDLDQLIHSSREISGKLRELIWTVYAQNDNLEKMIGFLHNYAINIFENSNIECRAIFPSNIPDCSLSGQKRHMILMAFKESLNNVLKHSRATSVEIIFKDQYPVYLIIIHDNGVGFDPVTLESPIGYGLSNMKTRMADIGGACSVLSSPGGTIVTFSINM